MQAYENSQEIKGHKWNIINKPLQLWKKHHESGIQKMRLEMDKQTGDVKWELMKLKRGTEGENKIISEIVN